MKAGHSVHGWNPNLDWKDENMLFCRHEFSNTENTFSHVITMRRPMPPAVLDKRYNTRKAAMNAVIGAEYLPDRCYATIIAYLDFWGETSTGV